MLIATFNSATGWAGKTITYDNGVFTLEGHGVISATDVLTYDRQGHLEWAYAGLREWVHQMSSGGAALPSSSMQAAATNSPGGPGIGVAGFVLSLLGISLIGIILSWIGYAKAKREGRPRGLCLAGIIIGFAWFAIAGLLMATAIPMFMNQSDKARESSVKEGIHSIHISVQMYAVENQDAYPDPSMVSQSGMASYLDYWPTNPYTGSPMAQGTGPGDYSYELNAEGTSFSLTGYGEDGPVISVP